MKHDLTVLHLWTVPCAHVCVCVCVCVRQMWEKLLSPALAHLCNCSQCDRAPLCLCHMPSCSCTRCATSAQPWGRRHRPGHFLRFNRKLLMCLQAPPEVLLCFFIIFVFYFILTAAKGEGEILWFLGQLFAGKQVRWSVTREDSERVHWRLTAKGRRQRWNMNARPDFPSPSFDFLLFFWDGYKMWY